MIPPTLFSAWSFASLGMLGWSAAVAIPIAIHLWSRRTRHEVSWAAMQFLLAAVDKQSRRLRIEQWLLLAIRVGILAVFALAVADPLLSGTAILQLMPDTNQRHHTVLVIDVSYSMSARPHDQQAGHGTLLDVAKAQAIAMVQQAAQGDGFTLVTLTESPRAVIASVAFERDDVIREINGLTIDHQSASLNETLGEVASVLERAERRYPELEGSRVVLFSDLGLTTWEAAATPAVRRQLAALAEDAELAVREIGKPIDDNTTIGMLTTTTPVTPVHRPITFEAVVRNHSLQEQRRRIEFLVDGQGAAQQALTVPAEGNATATFTHQFRAAGQHLVEARTDDDRVLLDNHRWLSVTTPASIHVLCVTSTPTASRYIELALAPSPAGVSDFTTEVVSDNLLIDTDLERYDCVILANVGRLGSDEAQHLRQFVIEGGGLITILGDQVQRRSYNEELAADTSASPLLPATLGELVRGGPHRLDALQYQHPLVAAFRGHQRAGLLTIPVWRYVRLQPQAGARPALAFHNGDPALISQRVGRGRSVLLATAADADSIDRSTVPIVPWSAIVSWPSFPPLLHEMVHFSISGRGENDNYLVGEPWELSRREPTMTASVVLDPNGDPLATSAGGSSASLPITRLSGVYRIEQRTGDRPLRQIAVNLPVEEGDLSRLAASDLPAELRAVEGSIDDAETAGIDPQPSQWFRIFLGAVILLVLVESAFAGWLDARAA